MICVTVYQDINDLLSARRKIWWVRKKEIKMTRFPATGIEPWPRTATWCGQMLYPLSCGELVNILGWILESCFRCPTHCNDQAWKHKRSSIGRKESRFNGLQWTQLVKRNSGHLDLPFLFLFFLGRSQLDWPITVKRPKILPLGLKTEKF